MRYVISEIPDFNDGIIRGRGEAENRQGGFLASRAGNSRAIIRAFRPTSGGV